MTLTREDPLPLRPQVRTAALRTAFLVVVTVAVFWAVTSYADDAVRFLRGFGLRSRQIEPWRLPAMAVLIGIPAWHTLSAASELVRVARRYRIARHWERQLDDPRRAAAVPPLGSHLIQGTSADQVTADEMKTWSRQHAWSEMAGDSPNAGTGTRTLVVHLGRRRGPTTAG